MASLVWNDNLDPTVEIISMQRGIIDDCIKSIDRDIGDVHGSCKHIGELLNQLEQLCQLHFMYEEQLLEGLNYPSVTEQKMLHESFLSTFEPFRAESDQCHTPSFLKDFIKLRLDFVSNMNNETMKQIENRGEICLFHFPGKGKKQK